jgi:hypothetical protein
MTTVNKIIIIIMVLLVTTNVFLFVSWRKAVASSKVQISACDNPIIEKKPTITYRTITKTVEVPGQTVTNTVNMTDEERNYYKSQLNELNQRITEVTNEVIIDQGQISKPVVPIVSPNEKDTKCKDYTGLLEYKDDNSLNVGITKTIYKTLSLGGSINTKGKLGVVSTIQW